MTGVQTCALPICHCAIVKDTSNEIPAARELFGKLDLDGKLVSLDAPHIQQQTASELVIEHRADYALTAKGNQPGLQNTLSRVCPNRAPLFCPRTAIPTHGAEKPRERPRRRPLTGVRTDHRQSLRFPFGRADRTGLTPQTRKEKEHYTTTDFIGYMSEEHDKRAISLVTAKRAKI